MPKRSLWLPVASVVVMATVAIASPTDSTMFLLDSILIYAIGALGLGLIYGQAGILSVGHGAILGAAAYATMLAADQGWPLPAVIMVAAATGIIGALVFAVPSLRLHGHYYVITTFAAAETARVTGENIQAIGGTGGLSLHGITDAGMLWLTDTTHLYLALAGTFLALAAAIGWVKASGLGQQLLAIRESELLARAIGVPVLRAKWLAFAISGFIVGVAGFYFGVANSFVAPDHLGSQIGIVLILVLIVGGSRHWLGPAIGALIYVALPYVSALPTLANQVIIGLILIAAVLFLPQGIVPGLIVLSRRLADWRRLSVAR